MSVTNIKQALEVAADLCRHFEGFSSKPYLCPANYWTLNCGAVYKPDGTRVPQQDSPITRELANTWLLHELEHNYMPGVLQKSPQLVNHPRTLVALTDFAYNLGVARYRASTLASRINTNDWAQAKLELSRWTRGGVLPGLVRRRTAEANLFP